VKKRIAIIGGGLAGMAAAVQLSAHGCSPIIIETRKQLGGRASSFFDQQSNKLLDNCQHVLMGCFTHLIDFYERLGVLDHIEWHHCFYWTAGQGIIDKFQAGVLPAPFHHTGALRRMSIFSRQEKRHIQRGMWRIIRLSTAARHQWQGRTFGEFLAACDQPELVIRRFWNTIVISACNLPVDQIEATYALQVFQEGFLAHRWSSTMGIAQVPLVQLYDPAEEIVTDAGGEILLGRSARAIAFDGNRVTGVVTDDGMVEATAVISAVPFDRLYKLASETLRQRDSRLQHLEQFQVSPILGVHLHFDQTIMDLPHLALVDHDLDWLFNKGVDEAGQQHILAVISAAVDWMQMDGEEIEQRVIKDIHSVLPQSKGLVPTFIRVIKEKRATPALTPEAVQYRPSIHPSTMGMRGDVPNLFLAGDWCDTGWPATMESAVRSGYAAAEAITGQSANIENIPSGWLASFLGLKTQG